MKRLLPSLVVISTLLWPSLGQAIAPGSIDPAFRSGLNRIGRISSFARQPDGKIIIAGRFETVQGRLSSGIARLLPNGQLDPSFNPGLGLNGAGAYRVILQPDGKILVAGDFERFHLSTNSHFVRLLPNGALDPTFSCNPSNEVRAALPLPDGRILIAGSFTQVNGTGRARIARLNANGSLDTTFNPGTGAAGGSVKALALADDQYYLVGGFTTYNSTSRPGIARVNANGSLDTTFNPGTGASGIEDIAIDADSRAVIVGSFPTYNGGGSPGIARINPNGTRDTTFAIGSGTSGFVSRVRILPSGAILLAGSFDIFNGTPRRLAARLRPDGSLDSALNLPTDAEGSLWDILPAGSDFLLGGAFSLTDSPRRTMCAQVTAAGRPSPSFKPAVTGELSIVNYVAAQPAGKALICGSFTSYAGAPRNGIARIFANGRLDPSFDARGGSNGQILDTVTQSDGRIIVVGTFSTFDGIARNKIARLLPNGRLDPTFVPGTGPNDYIQTVALSPTGQIYVGGNFTTWGVLNRGRIARLHSNGELDLTFFPLGVNSPSFPYVSSIAVNPSNGSITLGGDFTTCNGTSRNNIARLLSNGVLDTDFNPGSGPNGAVQDLALTDSSGSVVLAGEFTTYNGVSRNRIAAAAPTGTLSTSFTPGTGFDALVYKLDVQLNGRILAVGEFTTYDGSPCPGLVRIEVTGEEDRLFNPGSGPLQSVPSHVAALPSGRILVVGGFPSFDHRPLSNIVSLLGAVEASGARLTGALQPISSPEMAGTFNITFAAGNVFTAVLRHGTLTTTFRGTLDIEGEWSGFLRRSDGVEVAAAFQLGYTSSGYKEVIIQGTYLSPEGTGQLFAIKPFQSPSERILPGAVGYYTAGLIPTATGDPAIPEGTGIFTLTQGSSGNARLSGTTADGRPFTGSTSMSTNGIVLLHANLTGGAGGYLNGILFTSFATPARLLGGNLVWHRRPGPAPFANGFTQNVTCEGSLYVRPNSTFLDFASGVNNARLTLDLGHLPISISRLLTVSPTNVVTPNPAGTISDLTLTVNPRTGLFGGSFMPPGTTVRSTLRGIATTAPTKIGRGHTLTLGSGDTPPQRSSRLVLAPP